MENRMVGRNSFLISLVCLVVLGCAGTHEPNHGEIASSYGSRALVQFNSGNFASALNLYQTALSKAQDADLVGQQALYIFNIGRILFEMGATDTARSLFETSLQEFKRSGDARSSARVNGFLVLTQVKNGSTEEAWRLLNATSVQEDRDFVWMVKSILCIKEKKLDDALLFLDSASVLYTKKKAFYSLSNVLFYKALIAISRQQYSEASGKLDESLQMMDKAPERYRRWRVLLTYSALSFCQSDEANGKHYYERAYQCAPRGIQLPSMDALKDCSQLVDLVL